MIPIIVYLVACIGSPMSAVNTRVDAMRALNPRVTVIVSATDCSEPTPSSDDQAIAAMLASRGVK